MARSSTVLHSLVAVALLTFASTALAEPRIGGVVQQQFKGATGSRVGGAFEQLYFNRDVFAGETVRTPHDGSTVLQFADQTQLQVGQGSSVVLDRFVYDPNTGLGDEAISFSQGIFRFISGRTKNEGSTGLTTPTATLTIRGTKLIIYVANDGSTTVAIIEGAIDVAPCGGGAAVHGTAGQTIQVTAACNGARQVSIDSLPKDPAVESDYALAETGGTSAAVVVAGSGNSPSNGEAHPGVASRSFGPDPISEALDRLDPDHDGDPCCDRGRTEN